MDPHHIGIWFLTVACIASAGMLLYSTGLLIVAAGNTGRIALRVRASFDSLNLPGFQAAGDRLSASGAKASELIARSRVAIDSLSRNVRTVRRIVGLLVDVWAVGASLRR